MTLSRHDIAEYYSDPEVRKKLLEQIKDRPVLTVLSLPDGNTVHRRLAVGNQPINITQAKLDPSTRGDLAYYADRRYSEFHPVIGKTTDQLWVDVDPGPKKKTTDLWSLVTSVANTVSKMPGIANTQIAYSGGRGFYVRGDLDETKKTDSTRRLLEKHLQRDFAGEPGVVFKPPRGSQVRLDTSTLHDKGSIRALYSLNADTGRVSVPLTVEQLKDFDPVSTDVKAVLDSKAVAPGVPKSRRVHDLPVKPKTKEWQMAVQEHVADRAGKHWDLRLVDPHTQFAHSWAIPKAKFPDAKPLLAIRMPTHTSDYALNFGAKKTQEIESGYGKGHVTRVHHEPVNILQVTPNKVQFERTVDGKPEALTLFKTKGDNWLLKKGEAMNVFNAGYIAGLQKLGIDTTTTDAPLRQTDKPQSEEAEDDSQMPAGELARALAQLEPPTGRSIPTTSGQTVDEKLNRATSWDSPRDIPMHFMTGGTTSIPGGGF